MRTAVFLTDDPRHRGREMYMHNAKEKRRAIMAGITGCLIKERFKPGKRKNSFYQEQRLTSITGKIHPIDTTKPQTLYYIDNKTGQLKAKNTLLLR